MFSARGESAGFSQGAGGVRIVVTPTRSDGQASVGSDEHGEFMAIPEEWVTRTNPPFPADYIQAVIMHEMGHLQGFEQQTSPGCGTASVMSNTTLSSYRTNFTSCDLQQMNYYFGTPQDYDPCEFGCPEGYTTNCVGDQQPDSCGCCVNYSPIVIDRTGQPRFSSAEEGVTFAINQAGSILRVAWPLSPSTAFLGLDRNGNGTLDDGGELFGNTTRLIAGGFATDGYQALADLDGNGDRVLDASDPLFSALLVWHDYNRNGISEREELSGLAVEGVRAIAVEPQASERRDRSGNRFTLRAKIWYGKEQRFSYDVSPATVRLDSAPVCRPERVTAQRAVSAAPPRRGHNPN